ncbi:MAG: tetratricopeptide repeat-containing sensor histidine kinase [Bacteroidota bacterium]|nr:tetratricopeptide repeat-containing sensor histidine kinase [Bacteroidota bacterium]
MTQRIYCLIIAVLLNLNLQVVEGQKHIIDSIESHLSMQNDSQKVRMHIELSRLYYGSSVISSMQHAKSAYDLSEKNNFIWGIADAENWMGNVYSMLTDYNNAMDNYLKSLAKRELIGDEIGIASSYNNIAILYSEYSDFEKAIEYLYKAYEISEANMDEESMGINMNNLSVMYMEIKDYENALKCGMEALRINEKLNLTEGIANISTNLGDFYKFMNQYERAKEYQRKALNLYLELDKLDGIIIAKTSIAEILILENNLSQAELLLNEALENSNQLGAKNLISLVHNNLAQLYELNHKFEKALFHFNIYHQLQDSIFEKNKANVIFEKQMIFETENQLKEIELLEKDKSLQRIEITKQKYIGIFIIIISGFLFAIIILSGLFVQDRNKNSALIQTKNIELYYSNKQIEESRMELMTLNNAKDKFFSIIAHDLINPFNSFIGLSEILYSNIDKLSDSEIKKYSSWIHTSAKNLFHLVQNLLHWSRSQVGKLNNSPKYLDLQELVQDLITLSESQIREKDIVITANITKDTKVYADPDILSSILRNLIGNAIKFSHPGGKISIQTVEVGPLLKLSVEDSGVGIKNKDLKKLFSLKENFSSRGTNNEEGTGLGLILCKEFVEKIGGALSIKSREGKGSIFSFTIPTIPMPV